jgi:hypothetical protein
MGAILSLLVFELISAKEFDRGLDNAGGSQISTMFGKSMGISLAFYRAGLGWPGRRRPLRGHYLNGSPQMLQHDWENVPVNYRPSMQSHRNTHVGQMPLL